MTNQRGTNDLNEELPDEHEVIQHSLRESSGKLKQDGARVKQNTENQKPDSCRLDTADSSSSSEAKRNKRR